MTFPSDEKIILDHFPFNMPFYISQDYAEDSKDRAHCTNIVPENSRKCHVTALKSYVEHLKVVKKQAEEGQSDLGIAPNKPRDMDERQLDPCTSDHTEKEEVQLADNQLTNSHSSELDKAPDSNKKSSS